MKHTKQQHLFLMKWIVPLLLITLTKIKLTKCIDNIYPKRQSNEAAMVEWGHSAILQAIDAVVAKYGTQTSEEAYFEVEASIVLGEPINGNVLSNYDNDVTNAKLDNHEEVHGNMVILSNSDKLSDVELSKIAQNSGAAAVMVVNTKDGDNPNSDYIYSMEAQNESEEVIAQSISIPCIMVSLMSANQITSANRDENDEDSTEAALPDRIRLYSSHDRPFFEDVSSPTSKNPSNPVIYIIHNLLTNEECDALIQASREKVESVGERIGTLLDGIDYKRRVGKRTDQFVDVMNGDVKTTYLWKGNVVRSHFWKEIDDRIMHSTGFSKEYMSDFHIYKYSKGSNANLHYDLMENTNNLQLATISIFLNDEYYTSSSGGEIVYPNTKPSPIHIQPKKGMAVVHHNVLQTDENDESMHFDQNSIHGDVIFTADDEKWIAKCYFYKHALSPTKRIVLPIIALPFGGILPKEVYKFYEYVVQTMGSDDVDYSTTIFELSIVGIVVVSLLIIGFVVYGLTLTSGSKRTEKSDDGKKKKKSKKKNE